MSDKKAKPTKRVTSLTESFKEILTGVGTSLKDDVGKAIPTESWAQFLGIDPPGGAHGGEHDSHGEHGGHDDHGGGHDSHGGDHGHGRGHDSHGGAHEAHGVAHAAHGESHGGHESEKITTISGVLNPGKWLDLKHITGHHEADHHADAPKNANIAPAIDYHREIATSSESSSRRKDAQLEQKFKSIQEELKRMVESSNKVVQEEFGDIVVEQAPDHVGDYHINFLDWLLITIRTARQKVEDSGAWLSAMKGKHGKKNGGMLKDAQKHGNTSVSMSNERQVATQTG